MAKRGRAWKLERTVVHRRGQAPRSNRERIGYWSDFVGGRPVPKGTPLSARRRDGLARVLGTFADAWPREIRLRALMLSAFAFGLFGLWSASRVVP